jgi:hypothetical protein
MVVWQCSVASLFTVGHPLSQENGSQKCQENMANDILDVQRILHRARLAERGLVRKDAVNEAIHLELDFINIFIRLVQILGMQQRKR